MKKLKTGFLYKFLIILIINILFKNTYTFIFSILLLIINDIKKSYLYILIFIIIIYFSNSSNDFIRYGFIDTKTDKYVIVNKILYKSKVYNTNFEVGDIVYSSNSKISENENELKNNIKYTSKDIRKIGTNFAKNKIYRHIDINSNSALYKNIFYNTYDESINDQYNNISFGLTFYYFILLIFKRNKKVGLAILFLYSILFGFQIKFILIIIDFILLFLELDKIESLLFKILIICIINKYLLMNYSFLLGILISTIYIYKNFINITIIGIIQSILFGEVKIFNVVFYKAYIYQKISIFIFAILSLVFHPLENAFIAYSNILDRIFYYLSFSIRGSFNILAILLLITILSIFKVKNSYIQYLIFLLILITPINSLFTNVDFIDVGQGDSILIIDPSKQETVLIDTGSKYNYSKLKKELFSKGIYRINYLIITHNDSDHNGNIDSLKKDFKINNIITEGKDISTNNLYFKYLDISTDEFKDDNDSSLVYLLNVDGYDFLFTGDISSNIENNIMFKVNINDIDVLKVSHHGSKTASTNYFIGSIKPEIAVISTSGQYNHPHKEVIDTLERYSVNTYITKNDGNINFYFTNLLDFIITGKNRFDIINK